jgi:flavin reductase (DIM6/NTAB) family NADH-FMN oxidoreductase RutF
VFSGSDFRATLGAFATGVTVITTRGEDHVYGMTATAFSSVSMDPPLVLVCVKTNAEGSGIISANGVFAINILAADQEPISNYFASRDRPRGRDAFAEVPHTTVETGSPRINGVVAYLDCRLAETHESGDHLIFIGEVLALDVDKDAEPLLFHGSRYRAVHDG